MAAGDTTVGIGPAWPKGAGVLKNLDFLSKNVAYRTFMQKHSESVRSTIAVVSLVAGIGALAITIGRGWHGLSWQANATVAISQGLERDPVDAGLKAPEDVVRTAGDDTMPTISAGLEERFRAHGDDPSYTEGVIVTLAPGVDPSVLELAGMRIAHVMRNTPVVSGTINAAAFAAISTLDGVERIEADGTMRALDG
jgi:hypothetical protein